MARFCLEETTFRVRDWLLAWRIPATTFAIGVVSSAIVNIFTDSSATSFKIIFGRMTDGNSPLYYLMSLTIFTMIVFWIGEIGLSVYCKRLRWDIRLAKLIRNRTNESILKYSGSGLTVGDNLTLQLCPELHRGWEVDSIQLCWDDGSQFFTMLSEELRRYSAFREKNKSKRWYLEQNDGISVRLVRNPISFIDSPELILSVERCRYSQVQFTNRELAQNKKLKESLMDLAIYESQYIKFANTFVLHVLVITRDKHILATLSSDKKDYFSNSWSFSFEEQLKQEDIDTLKPHEGIKKWITRALFEELGVTSDDFEMRNFRVLSVFLEGNLNCGLCCIVKLSLDKDALDDVIMHRQEVEFVDRQYFSYKDAIAELRNRTLQMHPTSEYRLYLAMSHLYTPPGLAYELFGRNE